MDLDIRTYYSLFLNSEGVFLTGIVDESSYKNKIEEIERIRENKKNELKDKWTFIENSLKSKDDRQRQENLRNERNFLEKDTYEPQKNGSRYS